MELQERRKWRFEQTADDKWQWFNAQDGGEVQCEQPFTTLKECLDDAKSHGYIPAVPERRRSVTG